MPLLTLNIFLLKKKCQLRFQVCQFFNLISLLLQFSLNTYKANSNPGETKNNLCSDFIFKQWFLDFITTKFYTFFELYKFFDICIIPIFELIICFFFNYPFDDSSNWRRTKQQKNFFKDVIEQLIASGLNLQLKSAKYFQCTQPGLEPQSISALNQHISSVKTLFRSETLHLQNFLGFFVCNFFHYYNNEVLELVQAKLILHSLNITHATKLSLSRVS